MQRIESDASLILSHFLRFTEPTRPQLKHLSKYSNPITIIPPCKFLLSCTLSSPTRKFFVSDSWFWSRWCYLCFRSQLWMSEIEWEHHVENGKSCLYMKWTEPCDFLAHRPYIYHTLRLNDSVVIQRKTSFVLGLFELSFTLQEAITLVSTRR